VLEVPQARLAHYPRYLKAISVRLERLFNEPSKDQSKMLDLLPFMSVVESARHAPENQPLRWALEEFRVSVFAPELKTAEPVSVKRLRGLCER
jgi:ATP-dependent helicase HrpA